MADSKRPIYYIEIDAEDFFDKENKVYGIRAQPKIFINTDLFEEHQMSLDSVIEEAKKDALKTTFLLDKRKDILRLVEEPIIFKTREE